MEDEELETELERLDWHESEFDKDAEWSGSGDVPPKVKDAMADRGGRFYGNEHVYYLSKKGNITRYERD